jgi:7-keto-8-aminopelargonate synthetase-like enzyme
MNPLPPGFQAVDATHVRQRGRKLIFFGGCDYFRLASHAEMIEAVREGARRFGVNVAASRVTTGNHPLYEQLERALVKFFQTQAALLVANGYLTNLAVAQGIAGDFSNALVDDCAHVGLQDAAEFLNCPVIRFRHRDPRDLGVRMKRAGSGARILVLTDGLFAHDGTVAPLREYLRVLPRSAVILVDDAHGAGELGLHGRGTVEETGVPNHRIIQTITFSKAFGAHGGAILCSRRVRRQIIARSRLFAGHTPPALPLVFAALRSLRILRNAPGLRRRLRGNTRFLKEALRRAGFEIPDTMAPIIPVIPGGAAAARRLERALLKAGIHPPFLRYPGGPEGGCFRFVVSIAHTREQLAGLLKVLAGAARRT